MQACKQPHQMIEDIFISIVKRRLHDLLLNVKATLPLRKREPRHAAQTCQLRLLPVKSLSSVVIA